MAMPCLRLRRLFHAIAAAWQAPNDAIARCLARSRGAARFERRPGSVTICSDCAPFPGNATTVGNYVFYDARDLCWSGALPDRTYDHELVHVQQARVLGPFYLAAYAVLEIPALALGAAPALVDAVRGASTGCGKRLLPTWLSWAHRFHLMEIHANVASGSPPFR